MRSLRTSLSRTDSKVVYENPRRRRVSLSSLTLKEREDVVDRSEYIPKNGLPEHYNERFEVTCRLCGRNVTVTFATLYASDLYRAEMAAFGGGVRRVKCTHPKHALPARPPVKRRVNPGVLNKEDARALLAALGPHSEDVDRVIRRAVKRLRYIAETDD